MQSLPLSRAAGRSLLAFSTLGAALALPARAQTPASVAATGSPASDHDDEAVRLESFVLSASRTPQDPKYTPSAVSVVPLALIESAQITDLKTALAQQPGVIAFNNGGAGSQSTILMRGANSHQTLFVVDGVRMNDRSTSYLNFLGGADLGGIDRIEVLRGPQSTLYGSSAMGGVILIDTTHGCAPFSGKLAATAGSFDSFGASASVQGGTQTFGYSASLGHFATDNDRPLNRFEQWGYTARVEYAPLPALLVGATFRGHNGDYDEPGSRLFPFPGNVNADNYLTTVYGRVKAGENFNSRLTLATHRREYAFESFGSISAQRNTRQVVDWQNTWSPAETAELVGGLNYEESRYTIDGAPQEDAVKAAYVSTTLRPLASVTITAGARYDEFDSVGDATTWRAGVAWRPFAGTKLRATYGTGFSAPGPDDVYGVPQWGMLPNPNLAPEKSRGWDVGVDQEFLGGKATASATYFHNRFRNLFEWEYVDFVTFEGRTVNRSRATTEGVELALTARPVPAVQTRLSYTYLDARNSETNARLTRRPRHTADAEVQYEATTAWRIGAGMHVVADRLNGTAPFEDYTSVRLFTSYAASETLLLKLRVENALDETYEEVYGYPALSRAVHGSVEWKF